MMVRVCASSTAAWVFTKSWSASVCKRGTHRRRVPYRTHRVEQREPNRTVAGRAKRGYEVDMYTRVTFANQIVDASASDVARRGVSPLFGLLLLLRLSRP